jgi:hypothetical protein
MGMKTCTSCKEMKAVNEFAKNSYAKDGLRVRCKSCNKIDRKKAYKKEIAVEKTKRWRERHYEKHLGMCKSQRQRLKRKLVDGYGGKCTCCGESEIVFLSIEHVNRDGAEHRKKMKGSSTSIYREAIRQGFPSKYTILCMNCNYAKRFGNVCPHQAAKEGK